MKDPTNTFVPNLVIVILNCSCLLISFLCEASMSTSTSISVLNPSLRFIVLFAVLNAVNAFLVEDMVLVNMGYRRSRNNSVDESNRSNKESELDIEMNHANVTCIGGVRACFITCQDAWGDVNIANETLCKISENEIHFFGNVNASS